MPATPRTWKRWVRRMAIVGVACYLVILVFFKSLENSLVYHPTLATEDWVSPPSPKVEEAWFNLPTGERIHAWWLPVESPKSRGAILLCHGNGGNLSHRGRLMVELATSTGLPVLSFDYPGYGKSEGQPTESGCYESGMAAVNWLLERDCPGESLVLLGESLGGGVATELATRFPCRALILVKTFTSLPAAAKHHFPWLPTHWMMRNRFDSARKLPSLKCPILIAHGTSDRVVPFALGEALSATAPEPKHFLRLENHDHNDPLPREFYTTLREFLERTAIAR